MIALIIIGVFLLALFILLFLPLSLKISLSEEFNYKLTYFGIKIYPKKSRQTPALDTSSEKEKNNLVKKLYKENSFPEFLKILIDALKTLLLELKYILKHIKIRKIEAQVTVAADDAAVCGINYGVVCSLLYTFLEFLESTINVAFKKVDVNADFQAKKPSFTFSAIIKISPLFLIIAAVAIAKKYIQLNNKEGSALNERK